MAALTRHQAMTHRDPVEGCYACRISAVQLAPSATPTRSESTPGQRAFMDRFGAQFHNGDREAYKRLRADGLQPRTVDGSAHLERHATTRFEVETGRIYDDKASLTEALSICDDHGFDPLKPSLTEKA